MKNFKKLMSLALSVLMVAGCMTLPMTVSAADSALFNDFSGLSTDSSSTVPTAAKPSGNAVLQATNTFSGVQRDAENGLALQWNTKATAASQTNLIYLQTGEPASGKQHVDGNAAWISWDFKIDGTGFATRMNLSYDCATEGNSTWIIDIPVGKTTVYEKEVVNNGWHTVAVRNRCYSTSPVSYYSEIYLDGDFVQGVFGRGSYPYLWIYHFSNTAVDAESTFLIDNMKYWTETLPGGIPEEGFLAKELTEAEDWGAAPSGTTITDVDGGTGVDGRAVKMSGTIAANGEANKQINMWLNNNRETQLTNTNPHATNGTVFDIRVDYDMKVDDLNVWRNIGYADGAWNPGTGAESIAPSTGKVSNGSGIVVSPVGEWVHHTLVLKSDATHDLYINGSLEKRGAPSGNTAGMKKWYWWVQNKESAEANFGTEIDNFTIRYVPADRNTVEPVNLFKNIDFETFGLTSAGVSYSATTGATVIDGSGVKPASDRVMSWASTQRIWKQFAVDTKNALVRNKIEPSSTVRGGLSLMMPNGVDNNVRMQLTLKPANPVNSSVMSQPAMIIYSDSILNLRNATLSDAYSVGVQIEKDKWYRLDYEIHVSDGAEGSVNTIDFYLDGVKLNAEPIAVDYDYYGANYTGDKQTANSAVTEVTLAIIEDTQNNFLVDDITMEYIPAGETAASAIAADVLASGAAGVESNGGILNLMDAATSALTVGGLTDKLADDASVITAAGAAADASALANGNYVKLDRGIWPAVYYKASDLNVKAENGTVSAYMNYSANAGTVLFVAIYKGDGKELVVAKSDTSADGKLSVNAPVEDGTSYKVFLWNSNSALQPVYAVAGGALN